MQRTVVPSILLATLVLSTAVGGGAVAAPGGSGVAAPAPADDTDTPTPTPWGGTPVEPPSEDDEAEPADTVYVAENGDLVLAYRQNGTEDGPDRFDVALNASKGLVHLLVTNGTESNVTGTFGATLNRTRAGVNGSVVAAKPESVESLDFEATSRQTATESMASLDLQATVRNESASNVTGSGAVSTTGRQVVTPEEYRYESSLSMRSDERIDDPVTYEATVTETETGYRVGVHRNGTVSRFARERWDTRANATRTLEMRYNATAASLNGTSELTLERYSFTETANGTYRVDVAYTVEFRGVHEAVADRLTESLADQENLSLSESEARDISDRVQDLDVTRIAASVDATDTSLRASLAVELDDYDQLTRAMLDVAAAAENLSDDARAQIEEARARLDARAASGLARTTTWDASMTVEDATATVDVTVRTRTENWAAFVEELEARDLSYTRASYAVSARTEGDDVVSEASVTLRDDRLIADLLAPTSGTAAASDTEAADSLRTLRQAGFQRARLNASLSENSVTVRSAAQFDNFSAFQSALRDAYGGEVRSVVTGSEDGDTVAYVRVTGAVGSNPSEAAVRNLSAVGANTTVRMPGEWNRTFPAMDTRSAREYLGDDVTTPTPAGNGSANAPGTPGTSTTTPGVGVTVALLALLGAALVAVRRD